MVLSVQGVDYESLDSAEQQYAVRRLESALKAFGEGFHVYQYLFKTNRPEIPFAELRRRGDRRRHRPAPAVLRGQAPDQLYRVEIFYAVVLEGPAVEDRPLAASEALPVRPGGRHAARSGRNSQASR